MILKNGEKVNIFVSHDNSKTGIDSYNLLAGDREGEYTGYKNRELFDELKEKYGCTICGTCSGNCPGCYAKKMTRFPDVLRHDVENTIAVIEDPKKAVEELETVIFGNGKSPEFFRLHDSGDFYSYDYFYYVIKMIERHPETRFGAYTKESEIVNRYGIENLPENLSLQCSPWPGYCDPIGNLPQFIYDNGTDPEIAKLPHCPAVNKEGHRTGIQCKDCLYCYTCKPGMKRAVYAH